MKRTNGFLGFLLLILLLLNTSCRKEEFAFEGTPPEQSLVADSNVANLLTMLATNDGSKDNIVDGASCISLELPFTVKINWMDLVVDGPEDFETIESILEGEDDEDEDEDDDDDDDDEDNDSTFEIVFPVTVISADFTETSVSNKDGLQLLVDRCQSENDDDIECIDIRFPMNISVFNSDSEAFDNITLDSDRELFRFLNKLKTKDIAEIDFPITVILSNGTTMEVADLIGLENIIEMTKDDCDEDDNNDFDDHDCDDCEVAQLADLFANCSEWEAHKFEFDGENIKKQYKKFSFNFQADGTMLAVSDEETITGTWAATGSVNSVTMEINLPGLDDFNAIWNLKEIKLSPKPDVRLIKGNDELHFRRDCSNND